MPSERERDKGIATLKTYSKAADPSYHYEQMADSLRIEKAVLPDAMVHRDSHSPMEVADKDADPAG